MNLARSVEHLYHVLVLDLAHVESPADRFEAESLIETECVSLRVQGDVLHRSIGCDLKQMIHDRLSRTGSASWLPNSKPGDLALILDECQSPGAENPPARLSDDMNAEAIVRLIVDRTSQSLLADEYLSADIVHGLHLGIGADRPGDDRLLT